MNERVSDLPGDVCYMNEGASGFEETVCAMSNGSGGWIVRGDEVIRVEPASWYDRPGKHNGHVYRRVEGQNIISGAWACSVMSRDGLELSGDDEPIEGVSLNERYISEFRNIITRSHPELAVLGHDEFLRRCFVNSGEYLTLAGALMFGDCLRVRAVLRHNGREVSAEAHSIWEAYSDLLPRLTCRLSRMCSAEFREVFMNSLLCSDYRISREINITITSGTGGPLAVFDWPGLPRDTPRNHRLMKIAGLAGIGMSIKAAEYDMLNFRGIYSVRLEASEGLPAPVML